MCGVCGCTFFHAFLVLRWFLLSLTGNPILRWRHLFLFPTPNSLPLMRSVPNQFVSFGFVQTDKRIYPFEADGHVRWFRKASQILCWSLVRWRHCFSSWEFLHFWLLSQTCSGESIVRFSELLYRKVELYDFLKFRQSCFCSTRNDIFHRHIYP